MTQTSLDSFIEVTTEFISIARTVPAQDLLKSPAEGEWSAAYVIHHMADSLVYFATRFMNNLSEDRPAIIPFDEEVFPTALGYEKRSVETSLKQLEISTAHIADILRSVDQSTWKRVGIHPVKGELDAYGLLDLAAGHQSGHIDQIKKLAK